MNTAVKPKSSPAPEALREKNLDLWMRNYATPPQEILEGKDGGFKSVSATYVIQCATAEFGPFGEGWGVKENSLKESYVPGAPCYVNGQLIGNEIMHQMEIVFWFRRNNSTSEFPEVGSSSFVYRDGDTLVTNFQAPKSTYTNALTRALRRLGICADIANHEHDDPSYVRVMTRKFADRYLTPQSPHDEPTSFAASENQEYRPVNVSNAVTTDTDNPGVTTATCPAVEAGLTQNTVPQIQSVVDGLPAALATDTAPVEPSLLTPHQAGIEVLRSSPVVSRVGTVDLNEILNDPVLSEPESTVSEEASLKMASSMISRINAEGVTLPVLSGARKSLVRLRIQERTSVLEAIVAREFDLLHHGLQQSSLPLA